MQLSFKNQYARYKDIFFNIYKIYSKRSDLKKFLELFLSLAAVAVFSLFAVKPTVTTILALTKEIKAKEETIKLMDSKISNIKKAQTTYYQEKAGIDILNTVIPDNPTPEVFIRQIEGVSLQNAVEPLGISVSTVTIKGDTKANTDRQNLPSKTSGVGITFSGKGDYQALKKLAETLLKLRRPLLIDSLSLIKKEDKENESYNLILNVSGVIPYYNPISALKPNQTSKTKTDNE